MCGGTLTYAQGLDGTPTVNTFLFASHIVEVRCEGDTGALSSNCSAVKLDGSIIPVYRVPQDMYLVITSMEWRGSGAGHDDLRNVGVALVASDHKVRAYWDVPRFDNATHLYPTSGIVLPPNFQPSVCQASLTDITANPVLFALGLTAPAFSVGRMTLRGYLSPK
jgi:hypothetical protein